MHAGEVGRIGLEVAGRREADDIGKLTDAVDKVDD